MERASKIFKFLLLILVIISILVIGIFAYYKIFDNDSTIGVNYIGDQVPIDIEELKQNNELTQEEIDYYENRVLFTVNAFDNSRENGLECYELNIEYFTDYTLLHNVCRATGMQRVGGLNSSNVVSADVGNELSSGFTYYDTTNLISWSGGNVATQLNRNQKLIIKIDNKPYRIQLTGTYEKVDYALFGLIPYSTTIYWLYGGVFGDIMEAVTTNSRGYGDYYLTLNLSKFFTVESYDEMSGKFIKDTISDEIATYSVIKFHYEPNGIQRASQSLFGQVNCNSSYGEDEEISTNYWKTKTVYTLTEKDLSFRNSEVYGGDLAYLDVKTKNIIKNIDDCEINIKVDINSSYFIENNINFVGFDISAFEGINVNKLSIVNSLNSSLIVNKTINLLDKSFKDTNLKVLEYASGINLNISETAINSNYEGVAL